MGWRSQAPDVALLQFREAKYFAPVVSGLGLLSPIQVDAGTTPFLPWFPHQHTQQAHAIGFLPLLLAAPGPPAGLTESRETRPACCRILGHMTACNNVPYVFPVHFKELKILLIGLWHTHACGGVAWLLPGALLSFCAILAPRWGEGVRDRQGQVESADDQPRCSARSQVPCSPQPLVSLGTNIFM